MRNASLELWYFFIANLRASYFGIFLLLTFFFTNIVNVPYVDRFDFIFLAAVGFQLFALLFRHEQPKEFFVIILFHLLATIMELFKTHPSIDSWTYLVHPETIFVLGTVPLFTGFLYSAVGSYISRAFTFLKLSYKNYPPYTYVWILSILIYVNFFTHHFFYDIRYLLFVYTLYIFWNTKVHFKVYKKARQMPFLLTALLTASFVWLAENIGTYTRVWLYPNQHAQWDIVPIEKIGSWFLLLILSFAIVSIIYRDKIEQNAQ